MTTNHHTDIATGAAANAAVINSPLGELDTKIQNGIIIPAPAFGVANGSPTEAKIPNSAIGAATWAFGDSAQADISVAVPYKFGGGGTTITVEVYYAMETATSGDVRLFVSVAAIADTEDTAATEDSVATTTSVPGTAGELKRISATFVHTHTYAVDDIIKIRFTRDGGAAADSATGNLHFICCQVKFS